MIIDFHTHIFPPVCCKERDTFFPEEPSFELLYGSPGARVAGREDLLRDMDDQGIDRAVVFGFPWERSEHFQRHNDYIAESVARHPDRLTGFVCFSPRSPLALGETERCLEMGLSGVGELALYDPASSARLSDALSRDLLDFCSLRDVPILIHTNEPVGHQYPGKTRNDLLDIYRLVKDHPSNRFILAHWGGGLFFYALMKKEVREAFQNTWFDTAASPFLYTPDIYRIAGEIIGFERILFGSDYPLLRPGTYFSEMEASRISAEAMAMINGTNAAGLLGFPA